MNKLITQLLQDIPEQVVLQLAVVGCDLSQAADISCLSQGLSNQNLLIRLIDKDKRYVLRINSNQSNQICLRESEIANWRLAKDLAPALLYASEDQGYFLSEFIAADRDWSELETSNGVNALIESHEQWPSAEQYLLQLLQRLSRLPLPDNHISSGQQWQIYLDALEQCSAKLNPHDRFCKQWQQRYLQLLSCDKQVQRIVAKLDACMLAEQYSHRDLNPHNLLFQKDKLYCIDFEYACASHPLTDLASVLATHNLSTKQQQWLSNQYLSGHPHLTQDGLTALPAAIELYWFFACCWSLLMGSYSYVSADKSHEVANYLSYYDESYRLIRERDSI